MPEASFLDGVRTPLGRYGGAPCAGVGQHPGPLLERP